MSEYSRTVSRHRRLSILIHLEKCVGYTSNASILKEVVNGVGVGSTYDQIVTEINWLSENGFADHEDNGQFVVATATRRGVEIARGEATHPDIQRPSARRG